VALDAKDIFRRFEQVANKRSLFESMWQEISDNCTGRRDINMIATPGRKRMTYIYDNTSLDSSDLLINGLHTLLANMATHWFKLGPEDERYLKIEGVPEWFEIVENALYAAFNHPEARFMTQLHEVFSDLVDFGTAGLYIESVPAFGFRLSARPLAEIFISENAAGVVDNVYRKFPFTARQAVQAFGASKVPKAAKALEKGMTEDRFEFLHWVTPRQKVRLDLLGPMSMPWESTYLSFDELAVMDKGGYHEMPYMVPRWSVEAGETYGRGPGTIALPAQKMLNQITKTTLAAGELRTYPPWLVEDDSLVDPLRVAPGSVNIKRPSAITQRPVEPLTNDADPMLGVELLRYFQTQVQQAYKGEMLQSIRDPRMTATQVLQIAERMQILLSPTLGRVQVELNEGMIERGFGILMRQHRLPPPPMELARTTIKVEYISPVARAQKRGDADAIVELFTIGANLSQFAPQVLHNLDSDEAIRLIGRAKDAPLSVIRSQRQVAEIREAEAQMAQQAKLDRDMETAGNVAAKLLPAVEQATGEQAA
jgi:hypothetical protein